jgi:iron complex transport system substrate-binding protein
MRRARRSLTGALLALVAVTGLVACGDDSDPGGGDTSAPAGAEASAFPVSITHTYGTTEIRTEPKRIVTAGLVEQDALLALGVVPVATTEWFGGKPGAIWPWAAGKLNGAEAPEVLKDADGIQFEKIATLKPDLIVAVYSGLSAEDYATLSKIAPVVAQPAGGIDFGTDWKELTRTVGTAIGRPAAAERAVAAAEATITAARAAHPEFAGRTALMATNYEGYWVYGTQDPRGRLLRELGFALPPGLDEVTGEEFGANLSRERTDLLDVDALVWLVPSYATDKPKIQADPLYSKLAVKAEGRDVYLEDEETLGAATSFITVLSVPYLMRGLVPQLAQAVDGNPATAVTRATS